MSTLEAPDRLTMPDFSWRREMAGLFRPSVAPRGWWRIAATIYAVEIAVVAFCIGYSEYVKGNAYWQFGEDKAGTIASVAALALSGIVCFRIRAKLGGASFGAFWLAFGLLLCLAAADDLCQFHERIDKLVHHLLRRDKEDPVSDHLDDLIVLGYALPAMYLGLLHRRRLVMARFATHVLGVAFAIFAVHVVFDMMYWSEVAEETLKLTAGCTILAAFSAILIDAPLIERWRVEWHAGRAEAPEARRAVEAARRWVRVAAALAFVAVAVTMTASLFALASSKHVPAGTNAARLYVACAIAGAAMMAALFAVGHALLTYAADLADAPGDAAMPRAADAWRAASLAFGGALALTATFGVWGSRLYSAPVIPHHPAHAENTQGDRAPGAD